MVNADDCQLSLKLKSSVLVRSPRPQYSIMEISLKMTIRYLENGYARRHISHSVGA